MEGKKEREKKFLATQVGKEHGAQIAFSIE
jgi:hypothetical protein